MICMKNYSIFFALQSLVQVQKVKRPLLQCEPEAKNPKEFNNQTLFWVNQEFAVMWVFFAKYELLGLYFYGNPYIFMGTRRKFFKLPEKMLSKYLEGTSILITVKPDFNTRIELIRPQIIDFVIHFSADGLTKVKMTTIFLFCIVSPLN